MICVLTVTLIVSNLVSAENDNREVDVAPSTQLAQAGVRAILAPGEAVASKTANSSERKTINARNE